MVVALYSCTSDGLCLQWMRSRNYLLHRDHLLSSLLERDPELQAVIDKIEKDDRIKELEEELKSLKEK